MSKREDGIGPFSRTLEFGIAPVELGAALARAFSDEQADALNAFIETLDEVCQKNNSYAGMQLIRISEGLTERTADALAELASYYPQPREVPK